MRIVWGGRAVLLFAHTRKQAREEEEAAELQLQLNCYSATQSHGSHLQVILSPKWAQVACSALLLSGQAKHLRYVL